MSTPRKPRTTWPRCPLGVNVSVIVPVSPGREAERGVGRALGSTLWAHTSPVLGVTLVSNGLVLATAARFTHDPAGTPVAPNGPVGSGRPKKNPGATSGAVIRVTAALPNDGPIASGSPKLAEVSITIGTLPLANIVS